MGLPIYLKRTTNKFDTNYKDFFKVYLAKVRDICLKTQGEHEFIFHTH